jgi:hypothetical protein
MRRMLESLAVGDFSGRIGEGFHVPFVDGSIALTLAEVTDLARKGHAGPRRAPFSLVFRGPLSPVLPQRIWPLEHAAFGRLEIFLVPIGPDAEGMRYEAVFN